MTGNRPLFVYGSLMEPAVLDTLLDRVPVHSLALAHDFAAFAFPGKEFPVLTPTRGAVAKGHLLTDLSAGEMALLSEWEHPVYHFTPLQVVVDGDLVLASAFTVTEAQARDLGATELWDMATLTASLPAFLARCVDFRTEYEGS